MKKKIFLFRYSRANLGDDLFIYIITNKYKDTEFFIQIKEEKYKKCFDGIKNLSIIDENRDMESIDISKYDAFVYIGGSIFIESKYAFLEANDFKVFLEKINEKNIPLFYISSNFGPYQTEEYKALIEGNLEKCSNICFRDKYSYELFKNLKTVSYAPDAAYAFDYSNCITKFNNKEIGISVINLEVRENLKDKADIYYDFIKRIIVKYASKNYKVRLFSFCEFEGDLDAINNIVSIVPEEFKKNIEIVEYNNDIVGFLKKYSECRYMICGRFHSMILSTIFNQKIYNLSYSSKTSNFIEDNKIKTKVVNIKDLTYGTVLKDYYFRSNCKNKIKKISKKANSQFEKLDEFLNK